MKRTDQLVANNATISTEGVTPFKNPNTTENRAKQRGERHRRGTGTVPPPPIVVKINKQNGGMKTSSGGERTRK